MLANLQITYIILQDITNPYGISNNSQLVFLLGIAGLAKGMDLETMQDPLWKYIGGQSLPKGYNIGKQDSFVQIILK